MPILDLPNGYYELPPGKLANVVTCLEMKAKPHRALQPFPAGLRLKRFAPGDLEGHRALFRAVGSDLMWFSRLIMKDEELAAIIANPAVESYALMQGSDTLGMLELNFSDLPNCELAFYGLVPEAIGQGFGRALMDEAIRRAWAKPINRFWVHTCTFDSPLALPFYIRSGFTPYLRMVEVHDDPRLLGKLAREASPQVPVLE
ncbi:MAG: GNAT family N-acetyltransferase [Rhizobiales bacterium]|nr:GNAT family N-acetyltransferase [Hyphomicrobiales bacterium]